MLVMYSEANKHASDAGAATAMDKTWTDPMDLCLALSLYAGILIYQGVCKWHHSVSVACSALIVIFDLYYGITTLQCRIYSHSRLGLPKMICLWMVDQTFSGTNMLYTA